MRPAATNGFFGSVEIFIGKPIVYKRITPTSHEMKLVKKSVGVRILTIFTGSTRQTIAAYQSVGNSLATVAAKCWASFGSSPCGATTFRDHAAGVAAGCEGEKRRFHRRASRSGGQGRRVINGPWVVGYIAGFRRSDAQGTARTLHRVTVGYRSNMRILCGSIFVPHWPHSGNTRSTPAINCAVISRRVGFVACPHSVQKSGRSGHPGHSFSLPVACWSEGEG